MNPRFFLITAWIVDAEGGDTTVTFSIKSVNGHFVSHNEVDKIMKEEFPDTMYMAILNIMEFKSEQDYLDFGVVPSKGKKNPPKNDNYDGDDLPFDIDDLEDFL